MDKKLVGMYLVRGGMNLLRVFPVSGKKILFCSFAGKNISCNPMYFNRYLVQYAEKGYQYIWAVKDPDSVRIPEDLKNHVRLVKTGSAAYFFEMMTAGIVIYNVGLPAGSLVPKRKQQVWVNTWHGGGAFKAADMNADHTPFREKVNQIVGRQIDIFLSSNRIFTERVSEAMKVESRKFRSIGLPRNDLFFYENENCREKVCRYYGISRENGILLYAPTFRGNFLNAREAEGMKYPLVKEALEERFGKKFEILERKHHAVKPTVSEGVYPASDYPDMQELLAAADVLITDYSSCMWDFALTDKPGFLFFPDLSTFDKDRDFYTKPEQWPYECAQTMEELCGQITAYDRKQALKKRDDFMSLTESYEKGSASEQLMELLKIQKKRKK